MDREKAHQLLDRLDPAQLDAVAKLLEVMVRDEAHKEPTTEDRRAVAASRDRFRQSRKAAFPSNRWSPSAASPWSKSATSGASKRLGESGFRRTIGDAPASASIC